MGEELIEIGRVEREYLEHGKFSKQKIVDEQKFMAEFGTEVTDKIIKYINKPNGAAINTQQPTLKIKTIKEEAEWFLNKTEYGHIFCTPHLTMDDAYTWEIVDEVAKSILKGIMPKIKSEELLKRAKKVVEKKYDWEGKIDAIFIRGVPLEYRWKPAGKKERNVFKDIYDYRDRPAYGKEDYESIASYCKNPHILKWWNKSHDELIAKLIEEKQWYWDWYITDEILAITPPETIKSWRSRDPISREYAWENVLMYFAKSRAHSIGLTKRIRKAEWKNCPLCGQRFLENSLPVPLVKLLGGVEHIDFCSPCLKILYNEGLDTITRKKAISYIQGLANILQRVPNYDFGKRAGDLIDLDTSQRLELLKVLKKKPSIKRVKELFSSWLNALVEAGILEDGVRRTSRGTQCLAKDGHVCLSLGEKTIDDFLYNHNIPHDKESAYPESNYRTDFTVGSAFIEYFGLTGDPEYDLKMKEKKKICRKHGIRLISIYPEDLVSMKKLESKLKKVLI
jgi:hypothetical protein